MKNIFNIYTTGIVNWGMFEGDQNLVESWKLECRNHIINNIPEQYNINIYHYDPILNISSNYEEASDNSKQTIKNYINKHLIPFDLNHKKVKHSKFIVQRFTPDIVEEPYIIFDMAHLFKFNKYETNKVMYTSEYNMNNKEIFKLNVLRIGFVPNMEISKLILKNKLFRVNDDGNVITYIDMLICMNKQFDIIEPVDTINGYLQKIIRMIEDKICELRCKNGKKIPLFKIENIMKRIKDKNLIIAELMRELWDSSVNEKIFNSIAGIIIEKNIMNILQMDLIE